MNLLWPAAQISAVLETLIRKDHLHLTIKFKSSFFPAKVMTIFPTGTCERFHLHLPSFYARFFCARFTSRHYSFNKLHTEKLTKVTLQQISFHSNSNINAVLFNSFIVPQNHETLTNVMKLEISNHAHGHVHQPNSESSMIFRFGAMWAAADCHEQDLSYLSHFVDEWQLRLCSSCCYLQATAQ